MSLTRMFACIIAILSATTSPLYAQTLFTYGREEVGSETFLKAFNKNNTEAKHDEQSYREYLELYIRFRLKVKAASDARMDTLENQRTEIQGFRNQLADNYLKNDSILEMLVDEAFRRSLKDIRLLDIFIPLKKNAAAEEVKTAAENINLAYQALQKGENFEKTALKYNKTAGANNGNLGYISVFTLPYDLETLAYSVPPGSYSSPFRGKTGFHILKNEGERKAVGKLRAAQILLAFKPDFSANDKKKLAVRTDSIYTALKAGADFTAMAAKFSDDNLTYNIGGEMPAFEPGRYDPVFEDAAFSLEQDSAISAPVATSFGYHIIRRIQRIPVIEDSANKDWREVLKERVQQSDRMLTAQKMLLKKIHALTGYQKASFNEQAFAVIADSLYENKTLPVFPDLQNDSPLFTIGKETKKLIDFQNYFEGIRGMSELSEEKTGAERFDRYVEMTSLEYYRNHLEEYNPEFAAQLNEFREGNLLFEIMQQKVWDAATADTAALRNYYNSRKDKYWWELSADAIIVTCSGRELAEQVRSGIQTKLLAWKQLADSSNGNIQADSGRFELSQIPVAGRTNFTPGLITAGVKNEQDSSVTFAYIIRLYNDREPKQFEDARGAVINDYQDYLEEKWIAALKKRYPVQVKKKAFKRLLKK